MREFWKKRAEELKEVYYFIKFKAFFMDKSIIKNFWISLKNMFMRLIWLVQSNLL